MNLTRLVSTDFVDHLLPFLALAALLAAIVVAINILGTRWEKHEAWLATLDVRVQNLHKARKAAWVQTLQQPAGELVPPPLPPRAPTINATDWEEELVNAEELLSKQTGRYPLGQPPKEPNDEQ